MLVKIGTAWIDADRVYSAEIISDNKLVIRFFVRDDATESLVIEPITEEMAEAVMDKINDARSK